jgi:hypothetical protein
LSDDPVIEAEVVETEALIVRPAEPRGSRRNRPRVEVPVPLEICPFCAGPARLCGGTRFCAGGPTTAEELRWLTAIRSVYGALLLTPTPAALWGGTLLRLAKILVADRDRQPPSRILELAARSAPVERGSDGERPALLALGYLQRDDLGELHALRGIVRDVAPAPWLAHLWIGVRAAVASPLERKTFDLLAVACFQCADEADAVQDVSAYDAAIRCPQCGRVPEHPLPGVSIGEPHPVGRCVPVPRTRRCMIHGEAELDGDGLCVEGRGLMDKALVEAAAMMSKAKPFDEAFMDAVVRAQRLAKDARIDARMSELAATIEAAQKKPGGGVDEIIGAAIGAIGELFRDAKEAWAGTTSTRKKRRGKKAPKALRAGKSVSKRRKEGGA